MDDPDMGDWSYAYDALGNLKTQTDARGCVLTLTYDDLNRLDTKSSPDNNECGQQINVNYDYDSTADGNRGIGRRTLMEDGSGSTQWKYDARGRLTRETKTITGAPSDFVTEFAYNTADLPISMEYPDGEAVTTTYDNRMLPVSVTGNANYASMVYDSVGRMTSRTLGNGITQKYLFNSWNTEGGRLDKIVAGSGTWDENTKLFTNTLQKLSYDYDNVGNVTQIAQVVNFNNNQVETQSYSYDSLNRLTNWAVAVDGVNTQTEEYEYDSVGNLWKKNGMTLGYPAANGSDPTHPHAVTSAGGNTYTYDDNGNQITRTIGGQTVQLGYDAENRLVSVTGTNLSAQFTYNGDGQRVKSVVNNETIYFVGGHFEVNDTTDEVTKYYFSGASRMAVRKYIVPQTSTLNYLLGDHLGSTSVVTNEAGALVVETRYKPWGEVRWTTPSETLPTRYTFTGQYSYMDDEATDLGAAGFGLMFYNARWYDPTIGRFAQADTIVPGGVQGWDRYAYVNNSPVNYVDPSGHLSCSNPNAAEGDCEDRTITEILQEEYGITLVGTFTEREISAIYKAARSVGAAFAHEMTGETNTVSEAFTEIFNPLTFIKVDEFKYGNTTYKVGCKTEGSTITCADFTYNDFQSDVNNIVHELGHAFNRDTALPQMFRTDREKILHANGEIVWQMNNAKTHGETFGDFFVAWVFGIWGAGANDVYEDVGSPKNWMTTNMATWLNQ